MFFSLHHTTKCRNACHGLHSNHEIIKSGSKLVDAWRKFTTFIEESLDAGNEKGVVVAWGGKLGDAEWIYPITNIIEPEHCKMPESIVYFMDPKGLDFFGRNYAYLWLSTEKVYQFWTKAVT